ncbi:MAG: U32 family peptidase [Planctomycetota bacterium]
MRALQKPELLAPASGWIMLRAAVDAGADAVYFGAGRLNMRTHARNFMPAELKRAVLFCHERGVRAYLTLNTIVYENEMKQVDKLLARARDAGVDAVIVWDMAALSMAKKLKMEIHLSTQASISNAAAAEFYRRQGVSRVILARECTLKQIRAISTKTGIGLEAFIHGAMCVSISGRCFLSQEIFKRSANRGDCIQPCRRSYRIVDPNEGHDLELGDGYVMSPKDLCALPFLDRLIKAGITSFKIEGRNRSPEYVKTVTSVYRRAVDEICTMKSVSRLRPERIDSYMSELDTVYHRGFSPGFYLGMPGAEDFSDTYGSKASARKVYVGLVTNYFRKARAAELRVEAGCLSVGDDLLIMGNKTGVIEEKVRSLHVDFNEVEKAVKGQSVGIATLTPVRKNDKVYVIKKKRPEKNKGGR